MGSAHIVVTRSAEYTVKRSGKEWLLRRGCGVFQRCSEITMPTDLSGMIIVDSNNDVFVTPKILGVREC